jgi:hypothetical protein
MEPLLRQDGAYTLYRVEVQWGDGRWGSISDNLIAKVPVELRSEDFHTKKYTGRELEPFQSFSASGECWQKTGIFGVFDKDKAITLRDLLTTYVPEYKFRVVQHTAIQHRIPIEA